MVVETGFGAVIGALEAVLSKKIAREGQFGGSNDELHLNAKFQGRLELEMGFGVVFLGSK